jgi:putative transcriptional regulator
MSAKEREALLTSPPLEPSAELRARVLAAVEPGTRLDGFAARLATFFDVTADAARALLAAALGGEGWLAAPIPGVRLYHLQGGERVGAADCGLVRLEPGALFPRHRHLGDEWNFVLAGRAEEEGGEVWEPGDLALRSAGSQHAFRAAGPEPLLFAVVLHGGIEVTPA